MESKRNLDTTSYSLEYMGDKPREASAPYDMHCSMLERILGRSQIIELLNSDEFRIFFLQSSFFFFFNSNVIFFCGVIQVIIHRLVETLLIPT